MPAKTPFSLPCPPRVSPDLERCRRRGFRWMLDHGLTRDARMLESVSRSDPIGLAGRTCPYAVGTRLDLAADVLGFLIVADDCLSGTEARSSGSIAGLVQELVNVTTAAGGTPATTALGHAWADLWRRLCRGMSPSWRARSARHWSEFLTTFRWEDQEHRSGVRPGVAAYRALRHLSVGVEPMLDMTERVGGFEVAARAQDTSHVRRIRFVATEVVALTNDVESLEYEEGRGEEHNLVIVLEHHEGLSRRAAIEKVTGMTRDYLAELATLRRDLPGLCTRLSLTEAERDAVHWFADAACAWITGAYVWSRATSRYTPERRTTNR